MEDFEGSENIDEFEEYIEEEESVHSITESIHDFSQIITASNKDTGNYLYCDEEESKVPVTHNSFQKRPINRTNDNEVVEEDGKIPIILETQPKMKDRPSGFEEEVATFRADTR